MKSRYFRKALLAGALSLLSYLGFSQAVMVRTTTLFQTGSSTTLTKAFAASSTTGNLVVVHLSYSGQTVNITSVADNKGNTYTKINGPTNWGGVNFYRSELWYAYNITGGGANLSITATLSGTPGIAPGPLQFMQIYMTEFSGIGTLDPLDQKSVSIGSTSPFNSGSAIVNYSNELIYGAAIGGSAGAINTGATFTSIDATNSNRIEFKNGGAAGSYSATFTTGSPGTYVAEMATFRTTGSVLPVSLVSFDARATTTGTAELIWITASELNNDFFTVQRSQDAEQWQDVIKVKGAGNSNQRIDYETTDGLPFTGVSYYRLKQTDLDGQYSYSSVRRVEITELFQLKVYPNPSRGKFIILTGFDLQSENIKLYNSIGQEMPIALDKSGGSTILDTNIPKGIYILHVARGYWRQSMRVVIE